MYIYNQCYILNIQNTTASNKWNEDNTFTSACLILIILGHPRFSPHSTFYLTLGGHASVVE